MTLQISRPEAATRQTSAPATTRALLACGAAAGPLFVALVVVQLLTRDGFDLRRHPISLLSVGEGGWVQIANFVASGLLCLAFAVGLRRALHPGRAGTWGPILVGLFGVGLVVGGVFVADPGLGFPAGAPPGIPEEMSWHATVHAIAPAVAFNAVNVAFLVFARRFLADGQRGWAAYSAATAVAAIALTAWPSQDGISVRLAVAVVLAFAWTTALAVRLLRRTAAP